MAPAWANNDGWLAVGREGRNSEGRGPARGDKAEGEAKEMPWQPPRPSDSTTKPKPPPRSQGGAATTMAANDRQGGHQRMMMMRVRV